MLLVYGEVSLVIEKVVRKGESAGVMRSVGCEGVRGRRDVRM